MSDFGETIKALFREWDNQKALGASFAERVRNLERTVRAVWPFTREWHYLCGECSDYGLRIADCAGDATCGRTKPHLPHDFGTPCWCEQGRRYRARERTEESAVEAAAKVRKPSRFGR